MRFHKLGLKQEILRAIEDLGFKYPTPVQEKAIVGFLYGKAGISPDKLGKVAMKRAFSFFEVEKGMAQNVLKSLKGTTLEGRKIHGGFAGPAKSPAGGRP